MFDVKLCLGVVVVLPHFWGNADGAEASGGTIKNPLRFPFGGPFIGIFVAIATPLENAKDVYLSYNFEANYDLPQNQTDFDYPPIIKDRAFHFSRKNAYDALNFKLKSHGYPGKDCLLRTICEASKHDLKYNGVLGEIFHVLLRPSASKHEDSLEEYEEAERSGHAKGRCKKYTTKCKISILGLFSSLSSLV